MERRTGSMASIAKRTTPKMRTPLMDRRRCRATATTSPITASLRPCRFQVGPHYSSLSGSPNQTTYVYVFSVGATLRSVYTSKRKMVVSEGGDISVVAAKENDDGQELDRSLRQTESYDSADTTDTRLRLERRAVELEQEKVKLYLLKLDALQREKELGLPRSQVTSDL